MTWLVSFLLFLAALCTAMAAAAHVWAEQWAAEDALFAARAARLMRAAFAFWAAVIVACLIVWSWK